MVFINARTKPPKNAAHQLSTTNPGTNEDVIIKVTALMKKPTRKRTIQPNGRAINSSNGRINRLTIPNTKALTVATMNTGVLLAG